MYYKAVLSGNVLETYEYEKIPANLGRHFIRRSHKNRKRRVFTRREDSSRRCRKTFIRLVHANLGGTTTPAMFTFTMLASVKIQTAFKIFTDFGVRFRSTFGKDVRYLAVPEFQKRGAVHFHVLIWGLDEKTISEEPNNRRIQNLWGYGYVDGVSTDGSSALAGYLAKYMQKSLSDSRLMGKKAYSASRNLLRPVSIKNKTSVVAILKGMGVKGSVDNYLTAKYSFDTMWLGRGHYKVYNV